MEISIIATILLVAVLVLLICRSIVIWYTGINEVIKGLDRIEKQLIKLNDKGE